MDLVARFRRLWTDPVLVKDGEVRELKARVLYATPASEAEMQQLRARRLILSRHPARLRRVG